MFNQSMTWDARIHNEKNSLFNKSCWRIGLIYVKKKKVEYFLIAYMKINSK